MTSSNDRLRIMDADEIRRRLARMTKNFYVKRKNEITKYDVAKFFNTELRDVRRHFKGTKPISKAWQIKYSHFFALLDAGRIAFDPDSKVKTLIFVTPKEPPRPEMRPKIDFSGSSPTLKWDR